MRQNQNSSVSRVQYNPSFATFVAVERSPVVRRPIPVVVIEHASMLFPLFLISASLLYTVFVLVCPDADGLNNFYFGMEQALCATTARLQVPCRAILRGKSCRICETLTQLNGLDRTRLYMLMWPRFGEGIDLLHQATAVQALEAAYSKYEEPPPMMPTGLLPSEGEWHKLETKRECTKKRKAQCSEVEDLLLFMYDLCSVYKHPYLHSLQNYMLIYGLGREGYM